MFSRSISVASASADFAVRPARHCEGPRRRALRIGGVAGLIVLTVLLAPGCQSCGNWLHNGFKVGPDYQKPAAPIADHWIDFNDPRVISEPAHDRDWWRIFGDPTLDALVQQTYQGNLPLQSQGQRVLEFRAQRAIAVGNLLPQAQSFNGFYRRIQISENGNIAGVSLPTRAFDLWNIGPSLSWELDVWGRYRRGIEMTTAQADQQIELYDDVLAIAVADTARAYANLRAAEEFVRLARQNVESQQGSLKLAETRYREGAVSEMDVTQARSTLRETTALIPEFEIMLRQANNELCILRGLPMHDITEQVGEGPIPAAPPAVSLGIPGELMRRRPDVRAAERAVASASAEIGIAATDLFPQFSIDGSFSWTSNDVSDLFTGKSFGGLAGPTFRWNILNYGRIRNNISREQSQFQQAALDYQQTVLQANREVENALISFLKSQERAAELQGAVEDTKRSVEIALTRYREGATTFERIYNLQNVLVRQQIEQARARAETTLALIEVYRALRGGWQIRLDRPSGPPDLVSTGIEELPPVETHLSPPPQ